MDSAIRNFDKRQRAVAAKHRKLAQGYVTRLNRNGTIEHKPIRRIPFLTIKGLLLTLAGFVLFKSYLLAKMGAETYSDHVGQLATGNIAERAGAWFMGLDPASVWLASHLQAFFPG